MAQQITNLWFYLARRDRKSVRLLSVFSSRKQPAVRLTDLSILNLPPSWQAQVEKEVEDHKMYWEPWVETADTFDDLAESLKKRGYTGIPISGRVEFARPDQQYLPMVNINSLSVEKTMLRQGGDATSEPLPTNSPATNLPSASVTTVSDISQTTTTSTARGPKGPPGPTGPRGTRGRDGSDGASAYQLAVDNGFVGTEEEWLDSLVGPEGPTGPIGPGNETYTHNQGVAATTWNIGHSLGRYPNVTIVDSGGTVVYGDVTYVDDNNVTVAFNMSFGGKAYLN